MAVKLNVTRREITPIALPKEHFSYKIALREVQFLVISSLRGGQ